jgi:acyl-CoA synthetase (NDP forming)/GNAT superfamily N-acetyltransferase
MPYPPHWEADVVLADGGTAHLRPIRPDDADRLVAFHSALSAETIYFRFFAAYPRLTDRDLTHFTQVDYTNRVALVALISDEIVAVVRYERIDTSAAAEVAFVVRDDHQGRGLGSVLLEHIAACARERGIGSFTAEVLPENVRMIGVFLDAGYEATRSYVDGVVCLRLALEPTATSVAVMRSREHRAEARSIARLLAPTSVAVIGASREPYSIGHTILRNLLDGEFAGPVYPIHPTATSIASIRAYPSVLDVPGQVDLAVIATPAETIPQVVEECARKHVQALVVVSAGFADAGPEGRQRQGELVALARANGMRVVGPNCLGIANTDPDVRLNATLAPITPGRGRVGFFSQSGALGIAILEQVAQRGIGLSTFVSAGNRADVSGNDLLQYWEEDTATDVVLLYLESFGNPRKFGRLARRLAASKPVVVVRSGRSTQGVPLGHAVTPIAIPDAAVDDLLTQAGVVPVDDLAQLFDVAQLLAYQPLPRGERVAIVGNSDSLGLLAKDACIRNGLQPREPVDLGTEANADDFAVALRDLMADDTVDAVVTVFVPPLTTLDSDVARTLVQAGSGEKPLLTTFLAYSGLPEQLRRVGPDGAPERGSIPSYPAPERAVRALAHVARYAAWCRRVDTEPAVARIEGDAEPARALVGEWLARSGNEPVLVDRNETATLLACYNVEVLPTVAVESVDEALAAAERVGYPIALKTLVPRLRLAADLRDVRLDIGTPPDLRAAYLLLTSRLLPGEPTTLLVQRMAPRGVAVSISAVQDASFGGVLSFGLAGAASELLGDRAYRLAPLSVGDASQLVRAVRAAPLLFGYRGMDAVDVDALERLLVNVGRLVDDLPEVSELVCDPVLVAGEASGGGLAVLQASARLAPPQRPPDSGPRRLGLVRPS